MERLSRAAKKAETRRRLLDAAAEVFRAKGFQGASVEAICAHAGFTRGAFYSNFESKEEMFVELLQERVYEGYREMARAVPQDLPPVERLRWSARELQARYEDPDTSWLFELWLECLAHAARHPEFRSLAATFWSGTRALNASALEQAFEAEGVPLPLESKHLATALIALDIGLAVQHLVDAKEVPLDLYPALYELLFAPLIEIE